MALSIRHQWSLRRIEYSLRRSDRQFVATMSAFSAFALDGKMPQHERIGPSRRWSARLARLVVSAALRLMLLSIAAAVLSWTAARWLAAELAAVLRSGRDVRHAAHAGAGDGNGAGYKTLS